MTARHQIRFGNRRLARDRAAIDATPAPRLGEMLQLARENKGVDLFRAERDTKIRLRYLAALEDGDVDELPAAVYTKGFLRNYAIYLGLDPEEVLTRWRDEMQAVRAAERPAVAPPPRPLAAPRRGPTITPDLFMSVLLGLAVIGFVGFIAVQLMRFSEAPGVALTNPRTLVSQVNSENILLTGTSGPGALIAISGPDGSRYDTTANESGTWQREVPLSRGRNDFRVVAHDPVTRRESAPVNLIVNVPLPVQSPDASPTGQPPAAIQLSVVSPGAGAPAQRGPVTVSGSTTATRLTIASEYLGPVGGTPGVPGTPGTPVASPAAPGSSPAASPAGPSVPVHDLTVPSSGQFSEQLELPVGQWEIMVTASSAGLPPVVEMRRVTVELPDELVLEVQVLRREAWIRVLADGEVVRGYGGRTLRAGETHTFTASEEIWLRAGNAGLLQITLNGQDLGTLGRRGEVGNWIIRLGQPPEPTSERR